MRKNSFLCERPNFSPEILGCITSLDERHCSNNININQFNWYLLIPVPTAYSLLVFLIFSYSHTVWKLEMLT